MDQRRDDLAHWAVREIQALTGENLPAELSVVSGDASFRRYFRLHSKGGSEHDGEPVSWICVDAPPDKEDNPKFIGIARRWASEGVHVPAVLAENVTDGFMLLEDFGDRLLWPALHDGASQDTVISLYQQAIDELLLIQALDTSALPPYDEALLCQENSLFSEWLCTRQLGLTLEQDEQRLLANVSELLVNAALAQPLVTVHRDYHSRNLMLCRGDRIGVIDFQDAVAGPLTYDLVSLLRDCYVRWPHQVVEELTRYYFDQATAQKLFGRGIASGSYAEFVKAFDLMGMQRHLKAAGIFARLNIRDGKSGYLADIPNTCVYLREVAGRYPEFSDFCQWLDDRFLPALEQGLS